MILLAFVGGWMGSLLAVLFLLVSVVLVLTILIQRPQGGGLSGAFGSGTSAGQTAFGTKTGDALTVFTIVVFVVFVLSAVGLNFVLRPAEAPTGVDARGTGPGAPIEVPAGSTPAAPATGTPATEVPATQPSTAPGAEAPAAPASESPAAESPATPPSEVPGGGEAPKAPGR